MLWLVGGHAAAVCVADGAAVVAVGVGGGEAAGLVAGGLGGLAVVFRGLCRRGGASERPELQQGTGVAGQYRFPLVMMSLRHVPLDSGANAKA